MIVGKTNCAADFKQKDCSIWGEGVIISKTHKNTLTDAK
jgi:hypothetical protein